MLVSCGIHSQILTGNYFKKRNVPQAPLKIANRALEASKMHEFFSKSKIGNPPLSRIHSRHHAFENEDHFASPINLTSNFSKHAIFPAGSSGGNDQIKRIKSILKLDQIDVIYELEEIEGAPEPE